VVQGAGFEVAKQTMIDVGLWQDLGVNGNGHTSPAVQGNGKAAGPALSENEIIDQLAQRKGTTGDGFRFFGVKVENGLVVFPTYRLDGTRPADEILTRISSCIIDPRIDPATDPDNPLVKGKNVPGKPAGIFLPYGERPGPGETWIVCEGGKNGPCYHTLGYMAVGLNGHHIRKDFLPEFVAAFKGVNVIMVPDGDDESIEAFLEIGKALCKFAKSVKLASLPYDEIKSKGGDDVRDVLKSKGADAIRQAIDQATPIEGGEGEEPIPPPCSLRELITTYPTLRPAVIDGLLRVGETANIVAHPKRGKSWLVNSLSLCVSGGLRWLDTFQCTRGRVLLIDAELYREDIAYRLPLVAKAMLLNPDYVDSIDVWALRGLGVDLVKLGPMLDSIEPGRYALIILDAWYRFLPIGFSENDNAQVMALYNKIDAYASRLGAAWVNVHHASKGDQSGKGVTDVGSGAGSQSRAADTHLIIRQHEQEDVAVIEAVVRSWPPVERFAIRWNFPTWDLDAEADPRKLWGARQSRDRATSEAKDIHLNEDRQGIVNAMVGNADLQTKTEIRDSARIGNPRFGFAWASLLADGTIIPAGETTKGNNRKYEAFGLSHKETEF
jgi:hypothetical protein